MNTPKPCDSCVNLQPIINCVCDQYNCCAKCKFSLPLGFMNCEKYYRRMEEKLAINQ